MKTHIEHHTHIRKPNLELPILLKNLEVVKNKKSQWTIRFSSENHKYLCIDYNCSASHIKDELCEHGMAQGFTIETPETYFDEQSKIDFPEDSLILYLIPESEEESDELSGVAAILPHKHAYSACIVPYKDLYD